MQDIVWYPETASSSVHSAKRDTLISDEVIVPYSRASAQFIRVSNVLERDRIVYDSAQLTSFGPLVNQL